MRFAVFVFIFAVCLVAMECAASSSEENGAHQTQQQHDAAGGSVVATKAAAKLPAPEQEHEGDDDDVAEPEDDQDAPKPGNEDVKEPAAAEKPKPAPPPPVQQPSAHSQPREEPAQQNQQQQQQQQQQQLSQTGTRHGTEDSQRESDDPKLKSDGAGPISRNEEDVRTEHGASPERKEGGEKRQQKPNISPQPLKEQAPPSSHSTVGGEQKPSTSTTNTEHGTPKDITPPGTATTNREKDQVPAEKPATSIASPTDNAAIQTDITPGDKKTDSTQTSIPLTTESEKGEFTVPTIPLKNISKALQSSDNKDGTIGSSSLFALKALVTLVMMAVAPAF